MIISSSRSLRRHTSSWPAISPVIAGVPEPEDRHFVLGTAPCSAAPRTVHRRHVHRPDASVPEVGGQFVGWPAGSGGGLISLGPAVRAPLAPVRAAANAAGNVFGFRSQTTAGGDVPLDGLQHKADETYLIGGGAAAGPSGTGPVVDQVRVVASARTWGSGAE